MNVPFVFLGIVLVLGILVFLRYRNFQATIRQAEEGSLLASKPNRSLLRWGTVIAVLGLVLTLALFRIGFQASTSYSLHLGPWMLGGLVPLFLGLGLLLLYYFTDRE